MYVDGSKPNKRRSRYFVSMPHPNAKKKLGGEGVTYREELANGGVLNSLPEQVFFVEEEDLHT